MYMSTEQMIKELNGVKKSYENVKVSTCGVDIYDMCTDVIAKLEELKAENYKLQQKIDKMQTGVCDEKRPT